MGPDARLALSILFKYIDTTKWDGNAYKHIEVIPYKSGHWRVWKERHQKKKKKKKKKKKGGL